MNHSEIYGGHNGLEHEHALRSHSNMVSQFHMSVVSCFTKAKFANGRRWHNMTQPFLGVDAPKPMHSLVHRENDIYPQTDLVPKCRIAMDQYPNILVGFYEGSSPIQLISNGLS